MVAVLEDIQANRHWREVFPLEALEGCESALLLFSAGKCGAYDGIWVLEASIPDVTAVDWHEAYLADMRQVYPDDWEFVLMDAWDFARDTERRWDIVSVDPPSDMGGVVGDDVALWAGLAERVLVLGGGLDDIPDAPPGFELSGRICRTDWLEHLPSNGHWFWTIFHRRETIRRADSW